MTYFDKLNEDSLNIIFTYLDTYDILKLILICNKHKSFMLNRVKLNIETNNVSLHTCNHCNIKSMDVRVCVTNMNHKLCYNCINKCDVCNNSISNNCGCRFSNATPHLQLFNYGPKLVCCCGKKVCNDCIKTDFMSYIKCINCYNETRK